MDSHEPAIRAWERVTGKRHATDARPAVGHTLDGAVCSYDDPCGNCDHCGGHATDARVACSKANPAGTHLCTYERGHDFPHSWEGPRGYGKPVQATGTRFTKEHPLGTWEDAERADHEERWPEHVKPVAGQ